MYILLLILIIIIVYGSSYYGSDENIQELGRGLNGITYLINGEAVKIQRIIHIKKNYKYEIWRELDFYKYINKLEPHQQKYFCKLRKYEIVKDMEFINKPRFKIMDDKLKKKLDKINVSPYVIKFYTEYIHGENLENFLTKRKYTPSILKNILLQIYKGLDIMYAGGYAHADLHPGNIMVIGSGTNIKIKIIDYGEVLHKKYNMVFSKDSFKNPFITNLEYFKFWEYFNITTSILLNFPQKIAMCEKKKKLLPWEYKKDSYTTGVKKMLKYFGIEETRDLHKIIYDIRYFETGDKYYLMSLNFEIEHPTLHREYFKWCGNYKHSLPKDTMKKIINSKGLKELRKNIYFIFPHPFSHTPIFPTKK